MTGIAVTTPYSPEVDPASVCGMPARTSGLITAVPNPYRGGSAYEGGEVDRVLRFINLPERVRIEIVRAYWYTTGPDPTERWIAGGLARVIPGTGRTVRVLEKSSSSRSLDWDLRDDQGRLVPSGFYRVFFTVGESSENGGATVFDDAYVVQREDVGTWRDPTGCW